MSSARLGAVVKCIRGLADAREQAGETDATLLQYFVGHGKEAAFEALMRRHAGMVFGVYRRVSADLHDAEDAFQATFLLLAKKAGAIRQTGSLAGWLHGVAFRVASKARTAMARRRRRERQAARGEQVDAQAACVELKEELDAALKGLSEKYRSVLLLCYFEGLTVEETARQLGLPRGTVASRLVKARESLRRRLVRRGLGLPAAALTTYLLAEGAAAGALPGLTRKTLEAGIQVAAGKAVPLVASAAVAGLVRGSLHSEILAKTTIFAVLFLGFSGIAGTAHLVIQDSQASPRPPNAVAVARPDEKAHPARDFYGDPLPKGAVGRLGTVRLNHGRIMDWLFFLPDGKTLVSVGSGMARVWDAASGKELRQFPTVHAWSTSQAALSPDGKSLTLLTQEPEGDTIRTWDLAQGNEVRKLAIPVRRRVIDVWHPNAISPDGQLGAITLAKQIRVIETTTGKELFTLPNEESEQGRVVIFAGNDKLVLADKKQQVELWNARTGKLLRQFDHRSPAEVFAVSANGARLAVLGHYTRAVDRYPPKDLAKVWDLTTGKLVRELPAPPKSSYMEVRFSPDGELLYTSRYEKPKGQTVTVWNVATGKSIQELGQGGVSAISPGGTLAAIGWQKFHLVEVKTGRITAFADSRLAYGEVCLSPAGDRAFTTGSLSEWDVASGKRIYTAPAPRLDDDLPSPNYSADGRYAAFFEGSNQAFQIIVWDIAGRMRRQTLRLPGANQNLRTVFSLDSTLLATYQPGKDNQVRIWQIATGNEIRSFKHTQNDWQAGLHFSPTGTILTLAGRDVVGFDIGTGKQLYSWRRKRDRAQFGTFAVDADGKPVKQEEPSAWRALAVSPDGALSAGVLDGAGYNAQSRLENRIEICEAKTGRLLRRMDDSGVASAWGEKVQFSPDGRLLATSDGDRVHIWETATGKKICELDGHRGDILSVTFSANGKRLASSSQDSTCVIWDLALAIDAAGTSARMPSAKEIAGWWARSGRGQCPQGLRGDLAPGRGTRGFRPVPQS